MTRSILLALTAVLVAGTAQADDIRPMAGKSFALEAASGVVYYTREAEGFRVVATIHASEGTSPVRFVSTLSDGQAMTVSVPTAIGVDAREIEIRRTGETLSVGDAQPLMVRASLN